MRNVLYAAGFIIAAAVLGLLTRDDTSHVLKLACAGMGDRAMFSRFEGERQSWVCTEHGWIAAPYQRTPGYQP